MDKKSQAKELRNIIERYIDQNVKIPTFETVDKDFHAQDRIASILTLLRVSLDCIREQGSFFDEEYMSSVNLTKQEWERQVDILVKDVYIDRTSQEGAKILESYSTRKYLLAYVNKEMNWVAVSILSASYISASILMRSIFELLIGIATRKTGKMGDRIETISFLSPKEKIEMRKLWGDLCSWSHPYGKWVKEACPVFISFRPMFHSRLCTLSIGRLERLTDLLLVIALEKFKVDKEDLLRRINKYKIDVSNLTLFQDRC